MYDLQASYLTSLSFVSYKTKSTNDQLKVLGRSDETIFFFFFLVETEEVIKFPIWVDMEQKRENKQGRTKEAINYPVQVKLSRTIYLPIVHTAQCRDRPCQCEDHWRISIFNRLTNAKC